MGDVGIEALTKMRVTVWVPRVANQVQSGCIGDSANSSQTIPGAADMPAPVQLEKQSIASEVILDDNLQGNGIVFQYQSSQPQALVLCDQSAIEHWQDVRKLLANILYFVDLKPGAYHIANVSEGLAPAAVMACMEANAIERVIDFGGGCSGLEGQPKIRYVKLPPLARMLKEPLLKKQVLDVLIEFKH